MVETPPLGNWGVIQCLNEEHRTYLIAARRYADYKAAFASWVGAWLYPTMESEYLMAVRLARIKCENLWRAIPNKTEDLSKSH